MVRNVVSKVMWVGRATVFLVGLAVILALVLGVASTVSAHPGNKGFFHLGHKNVSKAVSTLVKQGPGPALSLVVGTGQPPLQVNATAGKATNLNADKLDGLDQSAFLRSTGKAADSDKLDGKDSTGFYAAGSKVADSESLDGLDSTAFGIKTMHNRIYSYQCDTPSTWNECAKIQVVVPEGKKYQVSIWSSMSWKGTSTAGNIYYCSAMKEPSQTAASCRTPYAYDDTITLPASQAVSASSSGETLELSAGTYEFSTKVYPSVEVAPSANQIITKIMVKDVAAPAPQTE